MNSCEEKNDASIACELQEDLDVLRQIDFFAGLPLEALKIFAFICTREVFKPEDFLFRQNDNDGQAFYILSGQVRLVHSDDKGECEIRDYGPGNFLGGLTLLGDMPRHFSLKAVTTVIALIMPRDKFAVTMQRFPEVIPRFIGSVVHDISQWEERFLAERPEACDACMHKVGVTLI